MNESQFTSRRITVVLIGILLVATCMRLYRVNYQSLWYDELHSIVPTDPANSLQSIIEYAKGDQPPVFFIYIHYAFKLFGYNEFVGRTACALIGVLSILVLYFFGKECKGPVVGLFAAFITTINYFHLYYSQELRFYSMTFLFAALSYLFFVRAFKRGQVIDFIGYAIFTSCLLYTHYYGMFIFCAQVLTFPFLLVHKQNTRFVVSSVIAGLAVMLSFIPWIPIILKDMDITSFWIKSPSPFFVAIYFYDYTGKEILTALLYIVLIVLFVKSYKAEKENKPVYVVLVSWIFWSYLIPYVRSITSTPILHERYTIGTLPAWILLFSIGWDKIENLKLKYTVPILLFLGTAINMVFFKQHYTRLQKDQFREASEIVKTHNTLHHPIYSGFAWEFNYYFRNGPDQVNRINTSDLSQVETFWLLQGHYPPDEMEAEVAKLNQSFYVVENYSLYGANALLMKRNPTVK